MVAVLAICCKGFAENKNKIEKQQVQNKKIQ